jgi:hypothetical protein
MFAYELPLDPPCNEWREYILPERCQRRIEEVCKDILKKGEGSFYKAIYAAIYELVEADIETEDLEADHV